MQVDALTLAAVANEFRESLVGSRIDDVIQPTPHAIALQCWGGGRNRWLLASAHPQLARIHFVDRKPRKLILEPPSFVMLLRKYLESARVTEIRQPTWERLLEIGFAHGSAIAKGETEVWLIVEVMGAISNLILRDDAGTILGALHLVTAEKNHYRTILPNVTYRYPPPQTRMFQGETAPRLNGRDVTAEELRVAALDTLNAPPPTSPKRGRRASGGPTLVGLLSSQIAGFSRDLAAEVSARATGINDTSLGIELPWGRIAHEARSLAMLPETNEWQPTLSYATVESARPSGFAVYSPQRFAEAVLRPALGSNSMLATYFEDAEWHTAVEGAKGELRRLLQNQHERTIRKDEALHEELRALDEAQRLREEADMLLAFQTEVPAHASSYTIENLFAQANGSDTPATMTLTLDPRYNAVENANIRYNRYHKLQRATNLIPPQIEANTLERARVEQLQTDLALAETPTEIAHVRAEVTEAGYLRGARATESKGGKGGKQGQAGKHAKSGKGGKGAKNAASSKRGAEGGAPLRRQSSDGFIVLVGKNSRQNEAVTFGEASANDLWLHARGVPGAHVIVKSGGRPVPEPTLHEAAALAAYYSQSRAAGSVPVDYTQQRYVRHMKGGGPGMVIYERERTLSATPEDVGNADAR